jgi:hypothetical protein
MHGYYCGSIDTDLTASQTFLPSTSLFYYSSPPFRRILDHLTVIRLIKYSHVG